MLQISKVFVLVWFVCATFCTSAPSGNAEAFRQDTINFLSFEPNKTEAIILELIENARETIEISLYGFENEPIAQALIDAHQMRGVKVRMSSELDSESSPSFQAVIRHGVPVFFGNSGGIMHNKYMIFDRKQLLTGSTNLTHGLFKHFNNTVVIKSPALIQEYLQDFEVQHTGGYYASQKDDGYDVMISTDPWVPKQHVLGDSRIRAYFTPYKDTFSSYTANRQQGTLLLQSEGPQPPESLLKECYDTNDPTDPDPDDAACLARPRTSYPSGSTSSSAECTSLAELTPPGVMTPRCSEYDSACYVDSSGRNKIVYSYKNYDQVYSQDDEDAGRGSKGDPKLYCTEYDNAMNDVIPLLRNAKKSILVLAFAFRDRLIQDELIEAKNRGIDVKIWIDYNQYRSGLNLSEGSFDAVAKGTGFLKICRKPDGGLLHHKVIVVDNQTVVLGSMNFSISAVSNNDENFVVIENAPALAESFYQEAARIDQYSYHLNEHFKQIDQGNRDTEDDPSL